MRQNPVFAAFLIIAATCPARADQARFEPSPLIACIRTTEPPKVDGRLDDACWMRAIWTSHFHPFGNPVKPKADIWMAVAHTGDALYVGWEIIKHDRKAAATKTHKDFTFMFVRPDRKSDLYFEFIQGVGEHGLEARRTDYTWKGEWKGKGRPTERGWNAEIMIPFKTLSVEPPKPGDVWGFSPGRKDPEVRKGRMVVWADIGNLHDIENYGRLLFVEDFSGLRLCLRGDESASPFYVSPLSATEPAGVRVPEHTAFDRPVLLNPSFESGLLRWRVRYSRRTYPRANPVAIAEDVRRRGKRALCVSSVSRNSVIQITNKMLNPPPGRFEVSAFIRLENPSLRDGVNLFVDSGTRKEVFGAETALRSTFIDDSPVGDGWRRQALRFEIPERSAFIKVGLEVAHYVGKVWVDDFRVTPCKGKPRENDGLWFWDARIPDAHGMAPRKRLFRMMDSSSPWIPRAQRYNDTLVAAAFARDRLKQLERVWVYNGTKPRASFRDRVKEVYDLYEKAARSFNELYLAKKPDELPQKLDPLLAELEGRVKALQADLDKALALEVKKAKSRAGDWPPPPPAPKRKRYRVRGDGSVEQLVFGKWSKVRYRTLGRALDFWDYTAGTTTPTSTDADGTFDWTVALDRLKWAQEHGIATWGLGTAIMTHAGTSVPRPPVWLKKYGKAGDIQIGRWLNYWNPAVLELHTGLASDMGRTLRGQDDILFYHYAWESSGPIDQPPEGSPTGMKSLRSYLKARYKTVEALNKTWGTKLESFDSVRTALLNDPTVGDAVRYDYQMWRQDAYIDHMKAIYQAWKKADPGTAVLAAHSNLFKRIDPTRIFETCDLLNCHTYWRLPDNLYLASTAPVEKKFLCKYENFWQYQEQSNRWGDERAQYAAIAKYLYRNALTGEVLQTWCFPYTSQPGWNWRQAQWCQTRNDYLTIRYCAGALPVAKRRVENVQHVFFLGAERDFSDVLLVWPRTTWLHRPDIIRKVMPTLVFWLHGEGLTFEYRTEARIASGAENLDDYKLVILPYGFYLDDGVGERLLKWVRAGGTLLTIGPAGLWDKHGRRHARLMTETIGVAPAEKSKEWEFGAPYENVAVIRKKVGRGTVAVVTLPIKDLLEDPKAASEVEGIIRRAAPQLARSAGDVFEFFRRIAPDGTRYLAVVNPNPDADVQSTITLRGQFRRVVDVDIPGGLPAPIETKDGLTRFPLRLQPAGMTVLRLDEE